VWLVDPIIRYAGLTYLFPGFVLWLPILIVLMELGSGDLLLLELLLLLREGPTNTLGMEWFMRPTT
jgi:hypothetical protein